MRGDIDDVRVYQKALSADEVGALRGSTTTVAASPRESERGGEGERDEPSESSPGKTVRSSQQSAVPDPPFKYQHFTLDTCKAKGPKQYKKGVWTAASVYSGCTVRWYGMSIWVPDPEDIFGGKKRKTKKRPDGTVEEQTDLIWRSTVVVNTYLGMPDGESIRDPGSDGATGPLKPEDISVWVSLDNITPDHIAAGQQEMSLEMTAASSGPNSTCAKTVDGDWAGRVDEWGTRTRYYRFRSTSSSDDVRRCSVFPWLVFINANFMDTNEAVPLWDRPKEEQNGSWNPPTVRCEDEVMGGMLNNVPDDKQIRYTGACTFPEVSRIYRIKTDDPDRGAVAQHLWKAFNQPDSTVPSKAPIPKIIPGNWNGTTAGTKAALTRVNEGLLRPGDPKGRTWGAVQLSARKKACRPLKTAGHCDEYPFNTAKQGPGWGDGNFSVKKIVGIENTNDGRKLQIFYSRYRVLVPDGTTRLDGDKYWVSVTGPPPQNP
ncbi:NucA/NucB deoxyribonuclease domain-containing protein [Streptosporangium lutulentum]|uniref:Deoxyribonuclease NucA/NucB domain-containing protein n=1 Tax=Streptosporangium lutulentum TaxID=1461250 RepID=A0ABT9QPC9_9ACTN|nr:hypothetical protein [Streptosporangium lutulentum]MDP9848608.1 hypothetical protein [Streptosporangium lutulentum]